MALSDALTTYFDGEKSAGLVLAGVGALASAWAFAVRRGYSDAAGMFWPVVLVGVLQLAVGVGLYARTGSQVAALHAQMERSTTEMLSTERPRMEKVQRNFVVIEVVELVLILVGAALALGFKGAPYRAEVGMGLVLQGAVMLVFDLLAERRGALYLAALLRAPVSEVLQATTSS